jgi:hypothetical protein
LRNEKQKKKFMGRGKQTSHPYDFMRDWFYCWLISYIQTLYRNLKFFKNLDLLWFLNIYLVRAVDCQVAVFNGWIIVRVWQLQRFTVNTYRYKKTKIMRETA